MGGRQDARSDLIPERGHELGNARRVEEGVPNKFRSQLAQSLLFPANGKPSRMSSDK